MNPYEMLIGAPPSTDDQVRIAAARLRGADDRAILAMLSGDRVLAPVGAEQLRQTQVTAGRLSKARQAAEEMKMRKQQFQDEWANRQKMFEAEQKSRAEQAAEDRALRRAEIESMERRYNAQLEETRSYNDARLLLAEQKAREKEQKDQAKADKYVGDETRRLSAKLIDEGVTDLEASIDIADEVVGRYFDPETGERKTDDIPGYGAAASLLPNAALSAEGKELRNVLASVRNKILKARSGAAVTDPEMFRLAEELGTAMGQTEEEMIQAYVNVRKALDHVKGGIYAGFAPEVVHTYETRLGANANRLAPLVVNSSLSKTRRGTTYEVIPGED